MASFKDFDDIAVTTNGYVATIEIQRPPHNFFDYALIQQIADAMEAIDEDNDLRAAVLCAQGKSFCAGANFSSDGSSSNQSDGSNKNDRSAHLYVEAVRLFATKTPIVGAIQGAAIGGGLGLCLVPDFRIACPESRFAANFTRLGFHPGFGLTHTLPALIGFQKATLMFYTSRRIKGQEAHEWGLADELVPLEEIRSTAIRLAEEIAENSPLGVIETRATMRQGLADRVRKTTNHELKIQDKLRQTDDFKEGVRAVAERRIPNFKGS
ncbi:MAG: enoyl-CoA hydratase [Rhodospirillaceae bacterium]|nr:enoyl-CoA hydratase [Rhodospirillaceae bacterium]|tara:strand:+ start:1938 stop:2738 length:801 start_codon:yes stop_codon:yes gene_type:complete